MILTSAWVVEHPALNPNWLRNITECKKVIQSNGNNFFHYFAKYWQEGNWTIVVDVFHRAIFIDWNYFGNFIYVSKNTFIERNVTYVTNSTRNVVICGYQLFSIF